MSVEPSEPMSEAWIRWQGQVVNGTFPLGRLLGSSDHSGVFLTRSAGTGSADIAIKLVPANRALAETLLPRWKRAGGLAHPHLLPLLQWGGCQLEGLPYLYVLMEYADQTLAQLLPRRALTEQEAREMLLPVLEVLAFLHGQDLVHGQLKPANILVVGEQLKLASDTVRRRSEAPLSMHALTGYDPPEARHGSTSAAGDIWALGVTLLEALTRRSPPASGESSEALVLPADFPPVFRDIVARCLSANPQNRPELAELLVFAGGRPVAPAPAERKTPEPVAPEAAPPPSTTRVVAAEDATQAPSLRQSPRPRAVVAVFVGVLLIVALVWGAIRIFANRPAPGPPPPAQGPAPSVTAAPAASVSTATSAPTSRKEAGASPVAVHEVIPDVPAGARRSIHGHIKVWVRVIVNQDGSVFAAVPDRAGPSRYFERLAVEAAQQWRFPPADAPSQRIMQLHFDFSRDGTTGRAVRVQ